MCKNCRFYLPVDVFSGLCKVNKNTISPDDPPCEMAELTPRCRYCLHYSTDSEYLGKCMNKVLAYPDMVALRCRDFKWQLN
jgi:hypothetical protein